MGAIKEWIRDCGGKWKKMEESLKDIMRVRRNEEKGREVEGEKG